MTGVGAFLRSTLAALACRQHRLFRWARSRARLGIALRLSIAFAAVAILAVVANAITEHGSSLIQQMEQSPVVASRSVGQSPDLLPAALDRLQGALLARVDSADAARIAEFQRATAVLDAARETYLGTLAPTLDAESLQDVDAQVMAHGQLADQLVNSADARRRLLKEFNIELDSLNQRMQASLDRVWAMFGKVFGREYLVEANRILDDMRRQAAGFALLQGYSEGAVRAMARSEKAFAALLRDNEKSIVRSFGEEWLTRTRSDLERLVWLRELLVRTDGQRESRLEVFSGSHTALAGLVRRTTSKFETERALASARRQSSVALSAMNRQKERQRAQLAWLTAFVLLVLLAVTVSTVTSVVRPVRRLLDATRRLAQGDTGVVVPRGGIKELDTLAVSFNQMADQLTAAQTLARQYHGQLEAKVQERTRQLQHLAAHDPLTRLPNRRQFLAQLQATLERAAECGHLVGVYFLDLDNFKNINDSMGHVFGDRVLQAIADRLGDAVANYGFCARLGGDEFTVVYEQAAHPADIEQAGKLLVRCFQEPLVVDGRELLMGLSLGASVFPEHGRELEALLRAADAALFHAKAQGRSQIRLFSPDLLDVAAAKFATEQGLRRAVDRGEFELFFQPEVDPSTFETRVVEALLRWRLPDGSYASPQDFLPVAEDCGLIREIGDWVLEATVQHAARWHATAFPGVRVAVNVSSLQLLDNRFVDRLQELLLQHRLPPQCIEIELTENVLQTGRHTTEALRQLRGLGVGVALDDFGTGYSSLVSLEQLPLTRVKLDGSLIATIDTSTRSQAIARAIVALCQSLELEITAEGVERQDQLAWLLGYPAMCLQGYLLSRPVPEQQLLPVISAMPAHMAALLQSALPANTVHIAELREARLRRTR